MEYEGLIGRFNGMNVISNPHLTEEVWKQTKWPRRHKKRWRTTKKFFQKYYRCFEVPATHFLLMTDPFNGSQMIVCHPMMYARLRNAVL